eukprot:jgi/Psemu1/312876/fgenesh1_kg.1040_\
MKLCACVSLTLGYLATVASAHAGSDGNDHHSSLRRGLVPGGVATEAVFPPYSQQCQDDAGPLFTDDAEIFGPGGKYHDGKPATPVGDSCPSPLQGACATKDQKTAFLEGPIDCGGKGWFCRILEEPGWPTVGLKGDLNFGYCNTTDGFEDAGFDNAGHCHGSDSDDTYYWWVRDHWHRQYNGRLRCCCGWDGIVTAGKVVNSCDYRRLVTPEEDVNECRDANEEGVTPYRGGCDKANPPALNQDIPEDDSMCWEVHKFGEPGDNGNDNDNDNDNEDNDNEDNDNEDNDNENEDNDNEDNDNENEDNDNEDNDNDNNNNDNNDNEDNDNDNNDNDNEDNDNDNNDNEDNDNDNNDNEVTCEDDEEFLFKGKKGKDCNWIKKKAEKFCNKTSSGTKVSESCPVACNACSEDENDEDNDEDDGEDNNDCENDATFSFKGQSSKNCDWIQKKAKKKPSICKKKSEGTKVSVACPVSCDAC